MKLDLHSDQAKLRRYVKKRVKEYGKQKNAGPGKPADPVRLITFGYYAEQGGYVNLVLDTRPEPEIDGAWTTHIENDINTCPFAKWETVYEAVCDRRDISLTSTDGETSVLKLTEASLNRLIGKMVQALAEELRADGTLAKLPLAPEACLVVEEFDGRFFWPTIGTWKKKGLILK